MAIHGTSDVIIPQVIAATAVLAALFQEVPLLRSAHVLDITGDVNYADGGDTVTMLMQQFGSGVNSAADFAKDMVRDSKTGATAEKIRIGSYTEGVTSKTIAIEYDHFALRDAARQADVNGFLGRIIAASQAETIQKALIDKAAAAGTYQKNLIGESTKIITVDSILSAKMLWGDRVAMFAPGNRPGLYLHSAQYEQLAATSEFKTLGTAATTSIVQAEQEAGAVCAVHGVPIYLLDSVPNSAALTVASITRSSAVATVTASKTIQVPDADGVLQSVSVGHGLRVGDLVTISGAVETAYNGTFAVASVPSATTFTYAVSGTPDTPATGTPVVTANYCGLMMMPAALGLTIKEVTTGDVYSYPGTSVKQVDTHFRYVTTRFRRQPVPVVKIWSR